MPSRPALNRRRGQGRVVVDMATGRTVFQLIIRVRRIRRILVLDVRSCPVGGLVTTTTECLVGHVRPDQHLGVVMATVAGHFRIVFAREEWRCMRIVMYRQPGGIVMTLVTGPRRGQHEMSAGNIFQVTTVARTRRRTGSTVSAGGRQPRIGRMASIAGFGGNQVSRRFATRGHAMTGGTGAGRHS